jgi:UPF0755 protein
MAFRKAAAAVVPLILVLLLVYLLGDSHPSRDWQPKKIVIPKGSTLPHVAERLEKSGILKHPLAFRLLVLSTMTGKRLQFGEYIFPAPPSAFAVWRKLVRGDVTKYYVTVTEGSNIYDVARLLSDLELADRDEFLGAAMSPSLLRRLEIEGSSVEGYLFPDTYLLVKGLSADDIIEIMVRQFRKKFTPAMVRKGAEAGFTIAQVVTIASIIEKETGVDSERPLVSAVIRKRLALGMPLQMDPTVIYGLKRFGAELTRKDLRTPTAYNSYLQKGLPPGPIANPGLDSLKAAVSPARADYLYFVSRNDGSHRFSRTLEEHNKAVALYHEGKEGEE